MSHVLARLLDLPPSIVYLVVGGLVFAEDALFFGFVVPGETAAVLGGVAASRGMTSVYGMAAVVVLAAVVGDTVGYEVGARVGPKILNTRAIRRRGKRVDEARELLARRGGVAVFLGRFVAFFRAVMPALAGLSRMPYLKFLAYNAAGGLIWGVGCVLLGYLAGNSYQAIEKTVGRDAAIAVAAIVVLALVGWAVRRHVRANRSEHSST
ncbi:MAG TPA: DedA family protein [Micromonosporaceae bacterium]